MLTTLSRFWGETASSWSYIHYAQDEPTMLLSTLMDPTISCTRRSFTPETEILKLLCLTAKNNINVVQVL